MLNKMCFECKRLSGGKCRGTNNQTWTGCVWKETEPATRENIRKSLTRLARFEKLADAAEEAYEAGPENIDREQAFDRAYELQFNEYVYLFHMITRFSGISENDAKRLINTKRGELVNMF